MGKGLGLYSDIGKRTRDLLYKDYQTDQKFTLTTYSPTGVLLTTITVNEPTPGLKTILSFKVPDQRSGKLELQYLHDYAGITSSFGLTPNPIVNFSASLVLSETIKLLWEVTCLLTPRKELSPSTTKPISLCIRNDKFDTLSASYYHTVSPLSNTAIGAEVTHNFSSNENTITVGTQHQLDPLTSVKARLNNFGKVSGLI
ncbi:hypothetical protein ACS0TY_035800 [Phlomoides rotata]